MSDPEEWLTVQVRVHRTDGRAVISGEGLHRFNEWVNAQRAAVLEEAANEIEATADVAPATRMTLAHAVRALKERFHGWSGH